MAELLKVSLLRSTFLRLSLSAALLHKSFEFPIVFNAKALCLKALIGSVGLDDD
jgi:hypothetical protein